MDACYLKRAVMDFIELEQSPEVPDDVEYAVFAGQNACGKDAFAYYPAFFNKITGKEVKIFFVNPNRKRSSSRPIYDEKCRDDFDLDMGVYNKDCLVRLGTCIAPIGTGSIDDDILEFSFKIKDKEIKGVLKFGEILLFKADYVEVETNCTILPNKMLTDQLDYEGEMGFVIGKNCRHASYDDAKECIYGFTIVNDVTVRD